MGITGTDITSVAVGTLGGYLVQSPLVLVWLVGLGLAITSWRLHPPVSLLATSAFIVAFVTLLLGTALNRWLPLMVQAGGWSVSQLSVAFLVSGVVQSLANAIAWGLMLAAVFARRGERPTPGGSDRR